MYAIWSRYLTRIGSIILIGILSVPISFSVSGQSERPRRVPEVQKPTETQTKPPADNPNEAIRINSNLIAIPVSVTDAAGQLVRNLTAEDFRIDEEGQQQQVVTLGQPGTTPIEIALLFDVSGSVHERFQFEQQAASRFLKEVLRAKDAASIFTIGSTPKVVQGRVTSVEKAIAGVQTISPTKEATAFFDTVVEAAKYLRANSDPGVRQVLVAISDGEDTVSDKYRLSDAVRELQRADSVFYAINPSGPSIRLNKISLKGQEAMTTLASATGGTAFLPDKLEDLDAVFHQIAVELQAQYLLGYYSLDERTDGGFRRIAVRVPKRPDLRIRARQGYYAPKA